MARPGRIASLAVVATLAVVPARAATFTVNSTLDTADVVLDGTCDADAGAPVVCTLRAALQEANNLAGADVIDFDIAPAGAQTIVLGGALPNITTVVTIDGTTQPGFVAAPPFAPVIEIDAAAGGASTLHVMPGSDGSTFRGLCVNRSPGAAFRIVGSSNNVVVGNFIGTNLAGTGVPASPPVNNLVGVFVGFVATPTSNNRIGGTAPADRNVISGSRVDGVQVTGGTGGAAGTVIQGNYIGTDVTGTVAIPNTNQGVAIFGPNTQPNTLVGGTAAGAGNLISGNGNDGILIAGAGTTGTRVEGNRIGTNAAGTAPLPNFRGIDITTSASGNTIGGSSAAAANIIAHNSGTGVLAVASAGAGNSILRNTIHSNGGLGIDLGDDGVTLNDVGFLDADTGPNDLLNYPVFASPVETAGTLAVSYLLDLMPGFYRIEFFRNPSGADPLGYGEGEAFASAVVVNHPGGRLPYFHSFAGSAGDVITATTTRCDDGAACADPGSTSEFGLAVTAVTTAVELMGFTALPQDSAVELSWSTASELHNLGFHLYRSLAEAGPWDRITPSLIPGLGSSPVGATYTWRDTGLQNGTRYLYRLEDVDTASVSTFHGPVGAVPQAGLDAAADEPDPGGDGAHPACTSPPVELPCVERYGDPESVSVREVRRHRRFAVVELRTGGFEVVREADGRVWVRVPGFEDAQDPEDPALPWTRAMLPAPVGKSARLTWVREQGVESFAGIEPSASGYREMEVRGDGTVRTGRRGARLRGGRVVVPGRAVKLGETVFVGESKQVGVELHPVRYDASRRALRLARRILVRVEFTGREPEESGRGTRGRRLPRQRARSGETLAVLHTSEPGLYAVRFEELLPGSRRAMSLGQLSVEHLGQAVPYHVRPVGGAFGPGSVLYLYAPRGPSSTSYASEVVYEVLRKSGGKRMRKAGASPHGDVLAARSLATVRIETNRIYQSGLLEAADIWLWENLVGGAAKAMGFDLQGVDVSSGRPGRLRVYLQGGSGAGGVADHHVEVLINGTWAGETAFGGKVSHGFEVDVPPSAFRDGTNELTVRNVGDTGVHSLVFLDRFEVDYPQVSALRGGVFEGEWGEGGVGEVAHGGGSVLALDVTDGASAQWLFGLEPSGVGAVRLRAERGRRYLLVAPDAVKRPIVRAPVPTSLRGAQNRADYVVIAPQAFLPAAQALVRRRQDQGLRTKIATLEEIASAFGHGERSAEAIRSFLMHAYHRWRKPSPRYVVLLGDASHDPRNFIGTSGPAPLPAHFQRTAYLVTASDPTLAAVNGDDLLPDLAIGRLPAQTLEGAHALVEKLIAWEDSGQGLGGKALLVADDPDEAGDFEMDLLDVRNTYLSDRETETIFLRQTGAHTRSTILAALDAGASLTSYAGHGGAAVWASENVLNSWDVSSLLPQSTQGVMLTWSCLNGYFVAPAFDSLGEAYLKAEGRGTIAAFSPSGLSLNAPAHQLHRTLMRELAGGTHGRLGDAILAAQESYAASGLMPELLSIYHLLGDPATRIR